MNLIEMFLNDYTLRIVTIGASFLGLVSGVIGSFAILKKQGLIGDAVSHAALPGIAAVFLLIKEKDAGLFITGALISGLLATFLIMSIVKHSRIKMDSAMALILSVFFGFGMVLLTYIQKIPNANQAGLDQYIFGQASTLLKSDVYVIIGIGSILLLLVMVFYKELKLFTFDAEYAQILGFSSRSVSLLLSTLIVFSIIIGLQTVGVILMSALLVAPGVAARQWTNRLSVMSLLAGLFGAISGIIGTYISSSFSKMPTGPSIIIVISVIVLISLLFAPRRGLIFKAYQNYQRRVNLSESQVLYNLYQLSLNHIDEVHPHPIVSIMPSLSHSKASLRKLSKLLNHLENQHLVKRLNNDLWVITNQGIEKIEVEVAGDLS